VLLDVRQVVAAAAHGHVFHNIGRADTAAIADGYGRVVLLKPHADRDVLLEKDPGTEINGVATPGKTKAVALQGGGQPVRL